MKTVSCWDHLRPYGINALTGEACSLMYRLLCDITEEGKHVIEKCLGCELRHAHRLAYARGLDLDRPEATPIGAACRLCHRHPCAERAAAPIDRPLAVDDWAKSVSPYPFAAA